MDSYEWNKIFGWLLAAAIAVLGLGIASGFAFTDTSEEENAYLPCGEAGCVTESADAEDAVDPMLELAMAMPEADAAKGANVFKKCATCHTIESGGANKQGPNLYGVMGRDIGSHAGFSYSSALSETPGGWTWEMMNKYIANPRGAIPGNVMAFAGISKAKDRADLFAYLNSQGSGLPLPPIPEVAEADPEETGPDEAKADDTVEADVADAEAVPNSNIGGPGADNQDADDDPAN
ncbi:MAG: cytochrome c family protein [Erythrobacter sp.]